MNRLHPLAAALLVSTTSLAASATDPSSQHRCAYECRMEGKCHYNPKEDRCDDGMERNSLPLMIIGIVAIPVGAVGAVGGIVLLVAGDATGSGDIAAPAAMLAGGTVLLLAAGPMVAYGASKVARTDPATLGLWLGPGDAGFAVRW